jgi:hypothetical protein
MVRIPDRIARHTKCHCVIYLHYIVKSLSTIIYLVESDSFYVAHLRVARATCREYVLSDD